MKSITFIFGTIICLLCGCCKDESGPKVKPTKADPERKVEKKEPEHDDEGKLKVGDSYLE